LTEYDDFNFDSRSDLSRIKKEIEEYKHEKNDKYGWQYLKDYVKCSFYYDHPEDLV